MPMELHRPTGRARLGFLLSFTTMLLWGVLPLALKVALVSMDPYTLTWYRFLASALLLGGVLAHRRRLPSLGRLARSGWALLGVATVFLTANYLWYLIGLRYTTPANSQVLIQLAPVLLALGGLLVFRERFAHLQWLGFGVLLLGLCTFVRDQVGVGVVAPGEYYFGSLLVALAALTWAIYGLAQKQLLRWLAPQAIMVCIYAGCAALLSPFSTPRQILDMNALEIGMLAFCALNTLVAYGTFSEALMHWEASRVGAVLALTPVVTIAAGSAATGLWPRLATVAVSPLGLLGAGLVVLGSLLAALGHEPRLDSPGRGR
jgi:drug/metabolite transporter (DMT)-like permease